MNKTELPGIYLKPGELYITDKPALVRTVLGSCVAVTMFNHRTGLGAMCHVLLPKGEKPVRENCFWFADCSIKWMIKKFEASGVRRSELDVKMFGGADVLASVRRMKGHLTVGKQNVKSALNVMEEEGLRLIAHDVGGNQGRKIFFYAHTGEVVVKKLAADNSVFQNESIDMESVPLRVGE